MALAANLRLAVTAITPIFATIRFSLHVSSTYTSLLMTLPLLCFALGAILTPRLLSWLGLNWSVTLATVLLAVANLIRPTNSFTMIIGTVLVGLGIAFLNVLVPTIITKYHPESATQITSYYSLTMSLFSAIGMGMIVPFTNLIGWRITIQLLSIPAIIALVFWLLSAKQLTTTPAVTNPVKVSSEPAKTSLKDTLLHDRYAWLLAMFMGLQSLIFYSFNTWLPAIYVDQGASLASAGFMLSVFQLVGIPAALLLTWILNQRVILGIILTGYLGGMLGILLKGPGLWVSAVLLGFTSALIFTFAMVLITSSSTQPQIIAVRSGFAQFIGYLIAAVGPLMFGQLHFLTGGWLGVIVAFVVIILVTITFGFLAVNAEDRR